MNRYALSLITVLLLVSLNGCKHASSEVSSEIPGSYSDTAALGQAYDSTKSKLYNVFCVKGTELDGRGNSSSELSITSDMDYKSIIKKLDGDLTGSATFPGVSAGTTGKFALDSQYDERSETHNIIWVGVNRKSVFKPRSLEVTEQGMQFMSGYKALLQDKCGDEFISEIQWGASLFATLKVQYLNSSDKFEIGGSLNVGVKADVVKLDASAGITNKKVAKRTKVSIIAKQFGGDATGLLAIIPLDIISCSFENMQPCVDAFNAIVKYATNTLAPALTGQPAKVIVSDSSGNVTGTSDTTTTGGTAPVPGGSVTDSTTVTSGGSSSSSTTSTAADPGADSSAGLNLVTDTAQNQWNVVKYKTARYDESGFEMLKPLNGWSTVDALTRQRRQDLQDRFLAETDMNNRASFLISSASGYLSQAKIVAIKDIQKKTQGNLNVLSDSQTTCLNEPAHCGDLAVTTLAALAPIDKSLLDIEIDQKRTVGIFNYYNIVGGLVYGGRFDDTKVGGNAPVVAKLRFSTTASVTNPGANASSTEAHLTGVTVFYKGGQTAVHGNMAAGQSQELDLSNDSIAQFKIYFTNNTGSKVTPRVTGLSMITTAGKTVTVGTTDSNFATVVVPEKEVFVGFAGSSGAEVDSIGVITRSL
ncbi:MAG: jacalin-like lectin [Proteobacteria bacterium]|nr:jacalin-like lectin [Pseudomonadota bacterium]